MLVRTKVDLVYDLVVANRQTEKYIGCCLSEDGKFVGTCSEEKKVVVWNIQKRAVEKYVVSNLKPDLSSAEHWTAILDELTRLSLVDPIFLYRAVKTAK